MEELQIGRPMIVRVCGLLAETKETCWDARISCWSIMNIFRQEKERKRKRGYSWNTCVYVNIVRTFSGFTASWFEEKNFTRNSSKSSTARKRKSGILRFPILLKHVYAKITACFLIQSYLAEYLNWSFTGIQNVIPDYEYTRSRQTVSVSLSKTLAVGRIGYSASRQDFEAMTGHTAGAKHPNRETSSLILNWS
jgi:hypothetical protein